MLLEHVKVLKVTELRCTKPIIVVKMPCKLLCIIQYLIKVREISRTPEDFETCLG